MRKDSIPVTVGKVPYTAEEAGYEEERLVVLDEHFKKLIKKDMLQSASYCVARDNKVFAHNSIGFLNYKEEDTRSCLPDTIYGVYSITKTVTCVAILQLVEDGLIRLDQPVSELLEEFKPEPFNEIQVWHLLTHTSGLHCDDGCKPNPFHKTVHEIMKPKKWIDALLAEGLESKPGTEWAYCSLGYNVLGEIITRVTGIFVHDYITKRVLEPCGMKESHWIPEAKYRERYSSRFDWMDEQIANAGKNKMKEKVPRTWNGLLSTDEDMMKFGLMLLNYGKVDREITINGERTITKVHVLGRKSVELMKCIHTTPNMKTYCWGAKGEEKPFGLALDVYLPNNHSQILTPGTVNHEGWGTCCLMIDHTEKFVAMWSAQFVGYEWSPLPLRNVASILWSGIM